MIKPTTTAIGSRAEAAVIAWLERSGAEILARNVRAGRGEVDIVARDQDLAMMIEVRTRGEGSFTSAFESITRDKRRRIVSAARVLWRTKLKKMNIARVRFDVASVTLSDGGDVVDYVKGAFTEGDA